MASPISPEGEGWKAVLQRAFIPWSDSGGESKIVRKWKGDWEYAVEVSVLRRLDTAVFNSFAVTVRTRTNKEESGPADRSHDGRAQSLSAICMSTVIS